MIKQTLAIALIASALLGETTLCYKENITTPSKIEKISLDGGVCDGQFSVADMKGSGWSIKDISISKGETGSNYTYIFHRENTKTTGDVPLQISSNELKSQLLILENEKKDQAMAEKKIHTIQNGKKIYEQQCERCHGANGEKKPYTSGALQGMTSDDFEEAMRDYGLNQRDNGAALIMNPYTLISGERKDVIEYLISTGVLQKIEKK